MAGIPDVVLALAEFDGGEERSQLPPGVFHRAHLGVSRGATMRHGREIMLGSQRKACLGMRQLEEAVLDVLFEARGGGERPGVVEVSRRAGARVWCPR